ncbi:hypothetical protein AVT69_gp285 [Pseudomonas phage PhiPA3]|uniref:Uncharacterized protein 287 n=1 Tax=Pseudomonas phage PhiPA3 TaxID=998086 RepID=F8SJC3_BPPA3|nr:hypothetical protein AVT69_gp285 [Pseudomonas phage PhiPA3]AEH03710.1 hypothetical protein [Pseudomonas phage PhiPA3]
MVASRLAPPPPPGSILVKDVRDHIQEMVASEMGPIENAWKLEDCKYIPKAGLALLQEDIHKLLRKHFRGE